MGKPVIRLLTLATLLLSPTLQVFADGPLRTLLLLTYHDQLPWQNVLMSGYHERLTEIKAPYQVFEERFDVIRLGQGGSKGISESILQKYKTVAFDQVIAESDTASQFLLEHSKDFKSAKKYFVNASIELPANEGIVLNGEQDFERGLLTIKGATPNLEHLVLLDESDERAQKIMGLAKRLFGSTITIEQPKDFSFAELEAKIAGLDAKTAVLFCLITHDKLGESNIPYKIVQNLAAKTKRPIFVIYDTLLGSGVVGGYVLSARKTGAYIADIVGGHPQPSSSFNGFYFDYKEAQDRGLSMDKFPAETNFLNRPNEDLSKLFVILISSLAFAAVQVFIIGALIRSLKGKRRAYALLEEERGHLAETVAERTKELVSAKEKAEAASKSKSQFLANMSHELRTPLNAVIGLSHILQETGLTKDQVDYNKQIIESSKHLLHLIGDVLDFSKIESGNLELSPVNFNLDTVISHLKSSFSSIAKQKSVDFVMKIDETMPQILFGDNLRLSQVLINLISNAFRFTNTGSVSLLIRPESIAENRVRAYFEVSDSGIGMTAEVLDKIFSPFTQADSSITRRYGGTGLGLSISKNIIDQMGGSIGLDSKVGLGTRFFFTINLQIGRLDPTEDRDELVFATVEKGQKILVVEDNQVNSLVIGGLLKKFEPVLTFAKNGTEAVEACRSGNFDLTFMDIQMPELDGISATKIIRSNDYFGPIVALTAGVTSEDHSEILQAGMNDFLEKPIDPEKLHRILARWLKTQ